MLVLWNSYEPTLSLSDYKIINGYTNLPKMQEYAIFTILYGETRGGHSERLATTVVLTCHMFKTV